MGCRFGVALGNARLQPRLKKAQAVAAFDVLYEFINGAHLAGAVEQALDEILVAIKVQKLADDHRGLLGADLLNVHLSMYFKKLLACK